MTVNGDRMVFHLINRTASNQERMWQNIYYIPPIENVKIKVRIPDGKEDKEYCIIRTRGIYTKERKKHSGNYTFPNR